jgi:streptogramin lyase
MTLLNPDGTPTAGSPYTQGPLKNPQGIAISAQNDVWIASFGTDSVVVYPGGDPTRSRSITGPGLARPFSLALDGNGTAWVTTESLAPKLPGSVSRISADGTVLPTITGAGLRSPMGVAIDSKGTAWVANFFSDSITRISSSGQASAIKVPAAFGSWGVAVDGSDHIWVAGFQRTNVTELDDDGTLVTPAKTGFTSQAFQHITAVQVDPSGNVWLANNWSNGSPLKDFVGGNGLVKLVGAATPVKTPLIGLPQRP